jgi:hypothetical protein
MKVVKGAVERGEIAKIREEMGAVSGNKIKLAKI